MTDRARLERLAQRGAARWRSHSDWEDLLQECRVVAWRHADEPDGVILWRCRCICIDCLRSWRGDRRLANGPLQYVSLDGHDIVDQDELPPSVSWGLAERHAVIADGLASGERPSDIAATIGVHPSRVSQHIAELRKLVV